jgi:simple sugar transport system permease protein
VHQLLGGEFWTQVVAGGLRLGVPVGLAALGELVGERSGILNLGIEGQMALGALIGFMAASGAGNVYVGLLAGAAVGAVLGALFATLVVRVRANQIVVGFAIAIGGVGLADFIYISLYPNTAAAAISPLQIVDIPGLGRIPFLGDVLFKQAPLIVWMLPVLAVLVAMVLRWSRFGLEIRASGFGPAEASARGVPVRRVRFGVLIFAGMMAGLAGAVLSAAVVGQYNVGMVNGRGFVAIALVIASGWRIPWLLVAALLFGCLEAFILDVQTLSSNLPTPLLTALPYAIPLVVLAFGFSSRLAPGALGQPFVEE